MSILPFGALITADIGSSDVAQRMARRLTRAERLGRRVKLFAKTSSGGRRSLVDEVLALSETAGGDPKMFQHR
jgi:hypothetical protein